MKLSRIDWIISIENTASRVAAEYGTEVVESVFYRYGVRTLSDLAPCNYSEVFADLAQIANDN